MIGDPDVDGSVARLDWLAAQVNTDLEAAPDVLWHYTNANGLQGILETDRLWATDARFLNDSQELAYGMDLAREVLASFDLTGKKEVTANFVRGLGDPAKPVLHDFLNKYLDVFVACFCGNGDLLSQWRAYTGNEASDGYAIGFRPPGVLPAWAQSAPGGHGYALRRVIYDRGEQEALFRSLIESMVNILDVDPTDLERQRAFGKHLVDGLVDALTVCKHPSFAEEKEWRIVYLRTLDPEPHPLRHRNSHGLLVPFVELHVPKGVGANHDSLPISHVTCGPSLEPDLKQRGVRSLLASQNHLGDVHVGGSIAPLRL